MANQQLVEYIKTQLAAGASKPDIHKAAAGAGWPLPDLDAAFAAAEGRVVSAPAPAPVIMQPQVQPQPITQPQEKPLPVIHMHPPGGVLRSWWLWTLIVVVLLVALGAAAYFLTPVGAMIQAYINPPPPAPVVKAPSIYTDPSGSFSFVYPEGKMPVPKAVWEDALPSGDVATSSLPVGSVEIPGVAIVSKVLLADMATSSESAIYDYVSCCSGTRYWLDTASTTWHAQSIIHKDNGPAAFKPLVLATSTPQGTPGCTLARQIGPYTMYRIKSGDEGVQTLYFYFLPTDKNYTLRFMTTSNFEDASTDPAVVQSFNAIISSLKLIDSTPAQGHCA